MHLSATYGIYLLLSRLLKHMNDVHQIMTGIYLPASLKILDLTAVISRFERAMTVSLKDHY